MNFGKLLFGTLILVAGVVLLAIAMGLVPADTIPQLLPFWPLLLVVFGLALLATVLKNPFLGCLATLLVVGAVAVGIFWTMNRHSRGEVSHGVTAIDVARSNIQFLTVRSHTFFGSLTLGSGLPRSHILSIEVRNAPRDKGAHRLLVSGKRAELEWPERRGMVNFAPPGGGLKLEIPEWMPVKVESWARFSSARVDLSRLQPERCDFDQFASSLWVGIGPRGRLDEIHIKGFLSTARIQIPSNRAVKLVISSPFTMKSLPSDFMEHAPGRGKARVFTSEGRGHIVSIVVDGPLLNLTIARAPVSEV